MEPLPFEATKPADCPVAANRVRRDRETPRVIACADSGDIGRDKTPPQSVFPRASRDRLRRLGGDSAFIDEERDLVVHVARRQGIRFGRKLQCAIGDIDDPVVMAVTLRVANPVADSSSLLSEARRSFDTPGPGDAGEFAQQWLRIL